MIKPMVIVYLLVLGGLGTFVRYGLGLLWPPMQFPLSTLVANVLGSLLIGALFALQQRGSFLISESFHLALMVGFLGALTTFSTYSLDLLKLMSVGSLGLAASYFVASNGLTLAGCYIGWRLTL